MTTAYDRGYADAQEMIDDSGSFQPPAGGWFEALAAAVGIEEAAEWIGTPHAWDERSGEMSSDMVTAMREYELGADQARAEAEDRYILSIRSI